MCAVIVIMSFYFEDRREFPQFTIPALAMPVKRA
jgi:hypothetical protein